ncbi:putative secreted protein [Streptomyces davaonensis JCM 4913]|uniref:Putative secreted protein n=2 Tax=Streptomyces davaonensis TaxID=348043 RepID=K4QYI0_STRDJ|nr:putative secreted protein [Streptomyces davaonensis JCM 4913]
MLGEAALALAAAGGGAVVEAAGTDAWQGLQQAVARWLGRGDAQVEGREMERLDEAAAALVASDASDSEQIRSLQQGVWQARFTMALENMAAPERDRAAAELRALLASHAPPGPLTSAPGGLAAQPRRPS